MKPGYEIKQNCFDNTLPNYIIVDNYKPLNLYTSYRWFGNTIKPYMLSEHTVAIFKIKPKP